MATEVIQKSIFSGCRAKKHSSEWVRIKIDEGDYPIERLHVPDDCRLSLFSEDGARLIHIGRRRQPLFIIGENSKLHLENLDLDYKGKKRFMIHGQIYKPDNVFLKNVKISRKRDLPKKTEVEARHQPEEPVKSKQLLDFLVTYILAYRKDSQRLTREPPEGAGYPSMLVNRAYVDADKIRGYLLKDGVVIADIVKVKPSSGYKIDDSMERMPSMRKAILEDKTVIEIAKDKRSLKNFIRMITLGLFSLQIRPVSQYGRQVSGLVVQSF